MISDRSVVFGIKPVLTSLLDSIAVNTKSEANEKLRKQNLEICLTIKGGDVAQGLATSYFGETYSKILGQFDDATLYFEHASVSPLFIQFKSADPTQLVRDLKAFISERKPELDAVYRIFADEIKQMRDVGTPSEEMRMIQDRILSRFDYFSKILGSLEVKKTTTGAEMVSNDRELAKELPERLLEFALNPSGY